MTEARPWSSEFAGKVIAEQVRTIDRLHRTIASLAAALGEVDAVIRQSHGVVGLHLNGDVADWEWLKGEWLARFDPAMTLGREVQVRPADERAEALAIENLQLRAALAVSKDPCVYCQLPAEDIARCASGFPGCARADDIAGCREFGAMMENATLMDERVVFVEALTLAREALGANAARDAVDAALALAKGDPVFPADAGTIEPADVFGETKDAAP